LVSFIQVVVCFVLDFSQITQATTYTDMIVMKMILIMIEAKFPCFLFFAVVRFIWYLKM